MSYVTGSAEAQTRVFYKEWWFILLVVLSFVILILLIISFTFIFFRRWKGKLIPGAQFGGAWWERVGRWDRSARLRVKNKFFGTS